MKKLTKIEGACAVLALKYVAKVPEEKAIEVCLGQGMFDTQYLEAAKGLGLRLERVVYKKIMLKKFIKKYPLGTFLAGSHNHLFVVDNGRVVDPQWNNAGLSRMILEAWRVDKQQP